MADSDNIIDRRLAEESGLVESKAKAGPVPPSYKVVGDSRVPVSASTGSLWKSRRNQALQKRRRLDVHTAWNEAIEYYLNNQHRHRDATAGNRPGNRRFRRYLGESRFSETENVIYSNTKALVPLIYAKNPEAEFTSNKKQDDQSKAEVRRLEKLMSVLIDRRHLNLKRHGKRCVLTALLTNGPWLHIGYTHREESTDQTMEELVQIARELEKAKDHRRIMELEGQLKAIEDRTDALSPSGPWIKFRMPNEVLFDSAAEQEDGSDGSWMMVTEFMPTTFVRAVYGKKNSKGEYESAYKPTHIMKLRSSASDDVQEQVDTFSIFDQEAKHTDFGYDNEEAFARAQMTKVWWVYDKTTRRVMLYNDLDWTWPIWVWDDRNNLDRFFPLYRLVFDLSPDGDETVGETSYYLDQQDAINEINSAKATMRNRVNGNLMYNRNVVTDPEDINRILRGESKDAVGLDLPPETDFSRIFFHVPPPILQYRELLDKSELYGAIDRVSSTNEIIRGEQLRTNTTNKALAQYQETTGINLEDRIDTLEDFLGDVIWGVSQLCLQYMEQSQVAELIGTALASDWRTMEPEQVKQTFSVKVVGGSTQKSTSKAKKREAIEVGQVLGQFAAIPQVVLVMLKLFQQAFDDINITEEDWQFIIDSIQQQGAGEQGGGGGDQAATQIEQLIQQLPPEAVEALAEALKNGVPLGRALQQIIQTLKGANGNESGTATAAN